MINPYFNFISATNEQDLVEGLVIEAIQQYGMDLKYLPKTLVDYDSLRGESPQILFDTAFVVEGYFDNVEGFMGNKNFLNKIGWNIEKTADFIVSKKRFEEVVSPGTLATLSSGSGSAGIIFTSVNQGIGFAGIGWDDNQSEWQSELQSWDQQGPSGASIRIAYVDPARNNASLDVSIYEGLITFFLATSPTGSIITTAQDILDILVDNTQTDLLITTTLMGDGSGLISPQSATDLSGGTPANFTRPEEGDLIYLPLTHDYFEVSYAEHEDVFYQLGHVTTWKITCNKYDFSHENFNTGNAEIDSIAAEFENLDSIVNDPLADNDNIQTKVESFLNIDPKSPFGGND